MFDTSSPEPTPKTRRVRRWRGWAINLALVLLIVLGAHWWKTRTLPTGEAPPLSGLDLQQQSIDLAALRGEPVLVYFWSSWCPVCKLMDGTIADIARDHRVVTVSMQSGGAEEIRQAMREQGTDFIVLADPEARLAERWGVIGVPTAFVIDDAGQIRFATVGLATGLGLRLRLWAARL